MSIRHLWTLAVVFVIGCGHTMPPMAGGSLAPYERNDVGFGGSTRIPVGSARDAIEQDVLKQPTGGGGVVPVAWVRHGLTRFSDAGLLVTPTAVRAEARAAHRFLEGIARVDGMYGASIYAGAVGQRGDGWRTGLLAPLTIATNIAGLYEVWLGATTGFDYLRGAPSAAWSARAVHIGPVGGMALGLRRVHVLIELGARREWWTVTNHNIDSRYRAWVMVPAFAVRLRL